MEYDLIVTRHGGLVDFVRRLGIVGVPVVTHVASIEEVRGKRILGVLPLHLASEAAAVTECVLALPAELRGVDLTAEQVAAHYRGLRHYVVAQGSSESALEALQAAKRRITRQPERCSDSTHELDGTDSWAQCPGCGVWCGTDPLKQ